jgi:hypothetical protein
MLRAQNLVLVVTLHEEPRLGHKTRLLAALRVTGDGSAEQQALAEQQPGARQREGE